MILVGSFGRGASGLRAITMSMRSITRAIHVITVNEQ